MKIVEIEWLNMESKEAEIKISDGNIKIKCYSCPFIYSLNEKLKEPLGCLGVENIVESNLHSYLIKKQSGFCEYFMRGKIISLKNRIVMVNGFFISLEGGYFPGDLKEGIFIEFKILRLEI